MDNHIYNNDEVSLTVNTLMGYKGSGNNPIEILFKIGENSEIFSLTLSRAEPGANYQQEPSYVNKFTGQFDSIEIRGTVISSLRIEGQDILILDVPLFNDYKTKHLLVNKRDVTLYRRVFAVGDQVVPLNKIDELEVVNSLYYPYYTLGHVHNYDPVTGMVSVAFGSKPIRGHSLTVNINSTNLRPGTAEERQYWWSSIQRRG